MQHKDLQSKEYCFEKGSAQGSDYPEKDDAAATKSPSKTLVGPEEYSSKRLNCIHRWRVHSRGPSIQEVIHYVYLYPDHRAADTG